MVPRASPSLRQQPERERHPALHRAICNDEHPVICSKSSQRVLTGVTNFLFAREKSRNCAWNCALFAFC